MEVVAAPPAPQRGAPFRDHDVREWSRIDTITGALERARLETDSWTASTNDACHKYGKVVDSRARTGADGSVQQQASRQLEVFQSRAAGSHLQVVKTKTVSSSRWSGKLNTTTKNLLGGGFEDLQLPLNPLDNSSQKSKASVGRSVNRRPPTRQPRTSTSSFQNDLTNPLRSAHLTAAANLHRVSRLCHQIHESAVRNAFGRKSPPLSRRESGDGSISGVEITEIEGSIASSSEITSQSALTRTKSTSSEDIYNYLDKDGGVRSVEDLEDLEQLQSWRRTSKVRRSLQYPKSTSPSEITTPEVPQGSVNVKKIREELEKGRRLNTALRNNSVSTNLEALDQIIQSISSASSIEKSSTDDNLDDHENDSLISKPKKKRDSFITVESLQEVKGRLRHTNSPGSDIYSNETKPKTEEIDDGIVTEEPKEDKANKSKVKSYVYGMENVLQNKKPVISTGSLESRSKLVNGSTNHKNEDWYNRRKSYGFEQVHAQQESTPISLKNKKMVESSTDSGICRSNDILVVPTPTKTNRTNRYSDSDSDPDNKNNNKSINGIHYGNVKKMTNIFNQDERNGRLNEETNNTSWSKGGDWKRNEIKSTTITIPIVKNNNVIDLSWNDDSETKRHSIAVDEAKYATDSRLRRPSLLGEYKTDNLDDDGFGSNRKTKKVEFCKTEVHFAAESGKVNIVETDEKPPPTQNFRRKRRNTGPLIPNEEFNRNGLPILHFGDTSYEKAMFNFTTADENISESDDKPSIQAPDIYENISTQEPPRVPSTFGVVTVNTNCPNNNHLDYADEDRKETSDENIKGILKNKPIKPKPYHLGESVPFSQSTTDEDSRRWGVRLRHVPKDDPPIWKSTVTVHNTFANQEETDHVQDTTNQPEFQKLLRNLRPIKKPDYMSDNENRYSDSFANIRVVSSAKDNRRSSWSVADKVEEVTENKGYSTKINFGEGQAIVVENDQSTWPRMENASKENSDRLKSQVNPTDFSKTNRSYTKYSVPTTKSKFSPVVLRKTIPIKPTDPPATGKPSSPILVAQKDNEHYISDIEYRNITDSKLKSKYTNENIVLRQPKKSEMTYFGVNVSAKSSRNTIQTAVIKESKISDKPDLLEHYRHSTSPTRPRKKSPNRKISPSPIYENLKPIKQTKSKYAHKEFDSSILDELTKAADQILQAVNGYTDEDCRNRLTSDEEEVRKPLDTISETKSWKNSPQDLQAKNQARMRPTLASAAKVRVKRTSSTSSVESLSKDRRKTSSIERKSSAPSSKPPQEKPKKKISSDSSSTKASTKARRLQRASSREALLQSHGSSSEDLPATIEVPHRKPRLIKKTKATQLTVSSGLELKKPVRKSRTEKTENHVKNEERILGSLPEIRHKTAVSTIRSTAEKCSRDRSRTRNEESRSRSHSKRETNNKETVSSSSTRHTSSTAKSHHHHHGHPQASSSQRSAGGQQKESGVTQHRISTANIKKCHRSEGARH